MRRCKTHGHLRPCPQCAQNGYGGPGRGQGRKSPLNKPSRVLVTLEQAELEQALARYPGSRSAAVRAVFLEGIATLAHRECAEGRSSSASPLATTPRPAVDQPARLHPLQKSFNAAYADLVDLRDQVHAGVAMEEVAARITKIRRHLSAISAQLRRQSRRGVVGTWFRRHDAPIHTQLAASLNHQPQSWTFNEQWWECPAMLEDLVAAAQAVEDGNYDHVLESLLPRIRHRLTLTRRYYR